MSWNYYDINAKNYFDNTFNVDMSEFYTPFCAALSPGARILDAGCGSGRDTAAFQAKGYEVDAFDASEEMVTLAKERSGIDAVQSTFSDFQSSNTYMGIWCCASLLHLPYEELASVIGKFSEMLEIEGIWYLSFKYGDSERDEHGRHFTDINEERLERLFEPIKSVVIEKVWITDDVRPERNERWLNAFAEKGIRYTVIPS